MFNVPKIDRWCARGPCDNMGHLPDTGTRRVPVHTLIAFQERPSNRLRRLNERAWRELFLIGSSIPRLLT